MKQILGQKLIGKSAHSPCLTLPIIRGRDSPGFNNLLWEGMGML